ncbi:MAG: QsdR family transcriptional regulator [Jatrophihabitans sp.]
MAPGERASGIISVAARWINDGRRLDLQALADELGVSRATVFRHVGGREDLLGKALALLTHHMLNAAAARADIRRANGELHSVEFGRQMNDIVIHASGLRTLLDNEPGPALRALTDPLGPVQPKVVVFVEKLLRQDIAETGLTSIIEPNALAYALVRMGESFLYADVLANREPDLDTANHLQQALLRGTLNWQPADPRPQPPPSARQSPGPRATSGEAVDPLVRERSAPRRAP